MEVSRSMKLKPDNILFSQKRYFALSRTEEEPEEIRRGISSGEVAG